MASLVLPAPPAPVNVTSRSSERERDLRDLCCTADEARELSREIVRGNGIRCTQWREVVAQIRMAQLRNPDGAGEVARSMASQIG